MSYNTVSTFIFLAAIVGIILMILRRLPEAVATEQLNESRSRASASFLPARLVVTVYDKARALLMFWFKRAWNFALEAKGMRHPSLANYRIRKIFRTRAQQAAPAAVLMNDVAKVPAVTAQDEQFFLQQIKQEPHNLNHYSTLGQFYLGTGNFTDAQNLYEYLVNRDATNSSYQAKLAYCKLHLKLYDDAAAWYEKSLALDPGHPNRYYNLALAYKVTRKTGHGITAIRKALELEPRNQKYKDLLKSLEKQP